MALEKIALILVLVLGGVWCLAMLGGMIALFPFGLPLLAIAAVVGYLLWRVVKERLASTEDDHYEKNVDQ